MHRRLTPSKDEDARIEACTDLATLRRWNEQAFTAASVSESAQVAAPGSLGRKVYPGAVVVLATALQQGPSTTMAATDEPAVVTLLRLLSPMSTRPHLEASAS